MNIVILSTDKVKKSLQGTFQRGLEYYLRDYTIKIQPLINKDWLNRHASIKMFRMICINRPEMSTRGIINLLLAIKEKMDKT